MGHWGTGQILVFRVGIEGPEAIYPHCTELVAATAAKMQMFVGPAQEFLPFGRWRGNWRVV